MKRLLIPGLMLAALVLLLLRSSRVGGEDNNQAQNLQTVTRSYEIGDLLISSPNDHPLAGDFPPLPNINHEVQANPNQNPANQGLFANSVPTQQQQDAQSRAYRLDEIKKYITDRVDPSSWKDNGGDVGSISSSPLRASLMITTTAENQQAIQKLMDELRASIQTIRVRVDYLQLSPGEIEKLQKNGADDPAALPEINRDLLRSLPAGIVHYTGSITCFNGQTVHLASGRAKTMVTSETPVVAPSAVAMDPTISRIHEGLTLEVCPTLSADFAIVDLCSVISEPNRSISPPTTQATAPALEHIDSQLQQLHTTVRVPLNKPVLIAGATIDPDPSQPNGKQWYLILHVSAGK